jgi:DNA-binding response OmpR family regulator
MKTKVLYVEDEPYLGQIVKESLESRHFEVYMATDGRQAAALFDVSKPHICVLDVMLPTKDGYTLAREIRHQSPNIPIIFVTAKTQTNDVLKGFESGGNDYIRKPFSMEELIVRINNLLALATQQEKNTPDVYRFGNFEFNVTRFELKNHNTIRKLSHREAALLQLLVQHKHRTLPRKDILLKLWGDDSFFNSRNLDVYITKLRDYLKVDPSIEIITIKGVGYNFVA